MRTGRGIHGAFERSWSGRASLPWTAALLPAGVLAAAVASVARSGAARARRPVDGLRVVAVGNLTAGGTGKSAFARWLALEALRAGSRPAVLLRGYGGARPGSGSGTEAVPDFRGYPLDLAARRYGDEAAAHRAALPREASVLVGRDRRRAALHAREGYGADVVVLDDGWEQRTLAWDALCVLLDPDRPAGNGLPLPAGPLRRPPGTLREAGAVAMILESDQEEAPERTLRWIARLAPSALIARFRRVPHGVSMPGDPRAEPVASLRGRVALVTAVGSPDRVERFARGAGLDVAAHVAYPDHARPGPARFRAALHGASRRGAAWVLITEKDEHRFPLPADPTVPIRVLRAGIAPVDPPAPLLERLLGPLRPR